MHLSYLSPVGSFENGVPLLSPAQCFEKLTNRKEIGFYKLHEMDQLWSQTQQIGTAFAAKFKNFIWVGIGGSSLGPKAMAEALRWSHIQVLENPDIQTLLATKKKYGSFKDVGFVFVSKSGTTIETLATLDFFNQELAVENLDLKTQSLVITELKSSSLYDWARGNQIPILEIPLTVGGRFSVLSSIGQLVIKLGKMDVSAFRQGAASVFEAEYKEKTLYPLTQFFMDSFKRHDVLTYFWYYSDSTYQLGKWLEQLWAESLAKKESPLYVAPAPIVSLGANDQHSILQQMMETQLKKSVVIHRFKSSEENAYQLKTTQFSETDVLRNKPLSSLLKTEAQAMTESQKESQHPVCEIQFEKMDESALGRYFMTYQLVVGMLGEFMQINAFNQPGVELGKVITKKILAGRS
ncbi:MAG: glucose-6-phosphate isomerase [Bdellovibrionaceae bacterium]|nr:glucose-6-phosphate isomerase [Pseudobdellovibrionaceae bacterium]